MIAAQDDRPAPDMRRMLLLPLAHIGVLKALDEQGIHVDAIARTSMGAVIAGLYAAGYSPRELEQLALNLDWRQALPDSRPRVDVPFRLKQDDRNFLPLESPSTSAAAWNAGASGTTTPAA